MAGSWERPDRVVALARLSEQLWLDLLGDGRVELTDTLRSHLAYEERELVGPLARLGFY